MRFRRLNRWRARRGVYFWLACPTCGQMFGGHEWQIEIDGLQGSVPTYEPAMGKGICPDCTRAGRGEPIWMAPLPPPQPEGDTAA